jgi:hypothetical protein
MKKLESLRKCLSDNIPELKRDADSLIVFANKGRIVSTASPSLAFVYHYQAECLLTDFNGSSDSIIVPLLMWIRLNQPELLMQNDNTIDFEAELLNHDTADISFTLELSERVSVQIVDGKPVITHLDEPQLPDLTGPTGWALNVNGAAFP